MICIEELCVVSYMLCLVMVITRGLDGKPVSVTCHISLKEKRHLHVNRLGEPMINNKEPRNYKVCYNVH